MTFWALEKMKKLSKLLIITVSASQLKSESIKLVNFIEKSDLGSELRSKSILLTKLSHHKNAHYIQVHLPTTYDFWEEDSIKKTPSN